MKSNSTCLCRFALALVLAVNVSMARADQKNETVQRALSKVPIAEVPARAAEIVSQAKPAERDAVAADVVKMVIKTRPTLSVATVGMISAKFPEAAPITAATAAKLQPKQVRLIAKSAAAAAPAQAGAIVKAVCKVVPLHWEVALAVAEGAPGATADIIDALGDLMPQLKARLDVAMASYHANVPSVAAVLYRVNSENSAGVGGSSSPVLAGSNLRGPSVGPPYIPLSGTPSYVPPEGGVVPPGGRDYARP